MDPVCSMLEQYNFDLSNLSKIGYEGRARKANRNFNTNRNESCSRIMESTIFRSDVLEKLRHIKINDNDEHLPKYSAISTMIDVLAPTSRGNDLIIERANRNDADEGLACQGNIHDAVNISTTCIDKREKRANIPLKSLSTALQHEIEIVNNIRRELEKVKHLERALNIQRDEGFDAGEEHKQDNEPNISLDEGDIYSDSSFFSE